MPSHAFLDRPLESLGIHLNVPCIVVGSGDLDLRTVLNNVSARGPVPPGHRRDHGGTGPQRKLSESLVGSCRNAEEVDEDGFLPNGVLIGENAHSPVFAEDLQYAPGRVTFLDDPVAVSAPQALHEAIHQGVVDRPHQNVQRTLDPAVGQRPQFPVAEVGCQQQDAPAA